ncbi:MAG: M56 family metallopeptidase [Isosphaerales bacterium]
METLVHAGLSNAVSATFLALVVACLGRVLARRPAVLHCLWLLVLLKLVTPPLYEVPIPWPKPFTEVQEPTPPLHFVPFERMAGIGEYVPAVPAAIDQGELPVGEIILELIPGADRTWHQSQRPPVIDSLARWLRAHWMPLVAMIWLAGTGTVLVLSAQRVWRFQLLLREARPACEETQEWVNELTICLGLPRPPGVWWIGGKISPLVWALGLRPRLIIPTDLWKGLDDHQRSTLIVHELAHLRRGDHRVRIFELVVTALFWWHPVLWWVRQALRDVEEQCCDAWVVWAFPESAKSYAETLLETLDFLNQSDRSVPLLASGFGKVHHLRKRLTMIMSGTTPRLLGFRGTLASLGMAVLLLPVNATWAQKPDQKKEIRIVVKSDDDSSRSADIVTRIEDNTPQIVVKTITSDDATFILDGQTLTEQYSKKPRVVHLEIKTDNASVAVTADSLEQAIEKLKEQIKALVEKSSRTDQRAKMIALQRAFKELENQIEKSKGGEARDVKNDKGKPELLLRMAQVRVAEGAKIEAALKADIDKQLADIVTEQVIRDAKITPETKAEIDKARAKVEELARSYAANVKKMEESLTKLGQAKKKLDQLEGGHHPMTVRFQALPHVTSRVAPSPEVTHVAPGQRIVVRKMELKSDDKSDQKPAEVHRFVVTKRADTKKIGELDQGRLEALEKKLQSLLEEVASLKKDRGK